MTNYKQLFYFIEQSLKLHPQFCDGWHANQFKVIDKTVANIRQRLSIKTVRVQRNNRIRLGLPRPESILFDYDYNNYNQSRRKNKQFNQNNQKKTIKEKYVPKSTRSELFEKTHKEFWKAVEIINSNPNKTLILISKESGYRKPVLLAASLIQKMDMLDEVGTMPLTRLTKKARSKNALLMIPKPNKSNAKSPRKYKHRTKKHQRYIDIFLEKHITMTIDEIHKEYKIPKTFINRIIRIMKSGKIQDLLNSNLSIQYFFKNLPATSETRKHRKIKK